MLLAVFVCTYFKREKKSQIHFSDVVRLPYCLVIPQCWPLAGWRSVGEGKE